MDTHKVRVNKAQGSGETLYWIPRARVLVVLDPAGKLMLSHGAMAEWTYRRLAGPVEKLVSPARIIRELQVFYSMAEGCMHECMVGVAELETMLEELQPAAVTEPGSASDAT